MKSKAAVVVFVFTRCFAEAGRCWLRRYLECSLQKYLFSTEYVSATILGSEDTRK